MCGGGSHEVEPRCENMEWNSMEVGFSCDVIDALDSNDQDEFCEKFGSASFNTDGLTLKQACCKFLTVCLL